MTSQLWFPRHALLLAPPPALSLPTHPISSPLFCLGKDRSLTRSSKHRALISKVFLLAQGGITADRVCLRSRRHAWVICLMCLRTCSLHPALERKEKGEKYRQQTCSYHYFPILERDDRASEHIKISLVFLKTVC